MKRVLVLFLSFLLLSNLCLLPATAAENPMQYISQENDQIIISQTIEDIGNGYYYVETIYVPSVQPYSNTKTGTKTSACVNGGTTIFSISVTGTFTYDGSSSQATSASGSISAYVDGVTLNSRRAYTSGASACAFGSVTYNGATLQKTVTLTCDKNGNLS